MHTSTSLTSRPAASTLLAVSAFLAVLASLLGLASIRPPLDRLWGDEGTFVAMTASLVRDGDLQFDEADLRWASARRPGPPVTVILQRTPRGITYSKPVLYPLLSAPLYALLGETGLIASNFLWLALALLLGWRFLCTLGEHRSALWTLSTFVCCSVMPAYVGWKMSDLMLACMILSGLVLSLGGKARGAIARGTGWLVTSDVAAALGALLLGGAVSMRFPAAALVIAAVLALLLEKLWRRALIVGAVAASAFLAVSAITHGLSGTANPYKAERSSFNAATGYPAGEDSETALERFTTRPATQSASWKPPWDARRSAFSTFYFFLGRHTGLLAYYPAALVLLLYLLGRPHRTGLAITAGLAAIVGFYLVWMPDNYFGGSTFLGNRYFLMTYPALLAALRSLPSARLLAVAWVVALVSWGSALYSSQRVREIDMSSQSHTRAGIFRGLPFESTARRLDGLAERYWDEDFLRFLDPFARPTEWSFRLDSRRPATEILLATHWPGESLFFVVSPRPRSVVLEVDDWSGRSYFSLPREPPAPGGLIEVQPAPAWRRHALWWRPHRLYFIRTLKMRLRSATDEHSTAVVRYAGRGRQLAPLAAHLVGPELPTVATAGSTTRIWLQLRNTGRRPWASEALLPIRAGYRLRDAHDLRVVARHRLPLPHRVRRGELVRLPMELHWPQEPGDYELMIELLREPVAHLGKHGRLPLAHRMVTVGSDFSRDSQEP